MQQSEGFCAALNVEPQPGVLRYETVIADRSVAVLFLKATDIAALLAAGVLHLGITGDEWAWEFGLAASLRCLAVETYRARVCLLVHENEHRPLRLLQTVVSSYPSLATRLLAELSSEAEVKAVTGSTEAMVPLIADGCVDVVETGATAHANQLRVAQTFADVTTHLFRAEHMPLEAVEPIVRLLRAKMEGSHAAHV